LAVQNQFKSILLRIVFEAKWFNKRVEELNAKFDDPKEIMAENI